MSSLYSPIVLIPKASHIFASKLFNGIESSSKIPRNLFVKYIPRIDFVAMLHVTNNVAKVEVTRTVALSS